MWVFLVLFALALASPHEKRVSPDHECLQIYGYSSCGYYQRAKCWADALDSSLFTVTLEGGTRDQYQHKLSQLKDEHEAVQKSHRTSPMVLRGCGDDKKHYVGGSDDLVAYLKSKRIAAPAGCW
jgi:hypothetical protein